MKTYNNISSKIVRLIKHHPFYYEAIYSLFTPDHVSTMNYGYAPVTEELRHQHNQPEQHLQYELYWQTFSQLKQTLEPNQIICEVSSGRGGGLAFLRNLTNAQLIGLERSASARRYAQKKFQLDIRSVVAPTLPLSDKSVDVFISIEAAHNYHNGLFITEIARCLKPNGYLLLADINLGSDHNVQTKLRSLYTKHGMTISTWRDIRPNVLKSLEQDEARKQKFMRYLVGPLKSLGKNYMGMVGSHKYLELKNDTRAYFILCAQKT